MQNLYPLFERNRILKKELLWSLRDYSFAQTQLEYQEYADGLLRGCEITIKDHMLFVGRGMVKHEGFVYLITEEMMIPYEPTEKTEILKMKLTKDTHSEDYIGYRLDLFFDSVIEKKQDELEVCRFKLRKGSVLRTQYQDFGDMETDYDTVNVLYADWGGLDGKALSPLITKTFAKFLLLEDGSSTEDINLAYLCLNQPGAVPINILKHYVSKKRKTEFSKQPDNQELFHDMKLILVGIQTGEKVKERRQEGRRQILVD